MATNTNAPCILLLNGFPGVGKLTIARELVKLLKKRPGNDVRLIDNHQVIDHVIQVLQIQKHSPAYYAARKSVLRERFFDHIEVKNGLVVVMTSVFAEESEAGVEQWRDHLLLAKQKGMDFYQVNIYCSLAINEERLVTEERRTSTKGKNTRIPRLQELRQSQTMIYPSTALRKFQIEDVGISFRFWEFDNSELLPGESALRIIGFLNGREE